MTVYRPKFVKQWNDPTTTLDWFNCTMASGAMALDFDTLGHIQVMGGTLRSHSGDSSGGTGLGSPGLTRAWAYYSQILHDHVGETFGDALAALRQYRAIVLQGMYGQLPAAYQSPLNSLSYTGPHAVVLLPEFNPAGDVLMGDPLNDKYIYVPQVHLRNFAAALGAHDLGYSIPQRIFFAASDAHVPVVVPAPDPVPYIHTVEVTASPYVNIREEPRASSADVGNLAKGARVKTTLLRRKGGAYVVAGVVRTDWLGFLHNGETDWIARAYTRVVT